MPDTAVRSHYTSRFCKAILSGLSEAQTKVEHCDLEVLVRDGALTVPGMVVGAICPFLRSHLSTGGPSLSEICLQVPDITLGEMQLFLSCLLSPDQDSLVLPDIVSTLVRVAGVLGANLRAASTEAERLGHSTGVEESANFKKNLTKEVVGREERSPSSNSLQLPSSGARDVIRLRPDSSDQMDNLGSSQQVGSSKCLFTLSSVDLEKVTDDVLTENFSDQLGRLVCLVCYKILGPSDFPAYRSHVASHEARQLEKITIIMPDIGRGGPGLKKKFVTDYELDSLYSDSSGLFLQCPKCERRTTVGEKASFRKHLTYHTHREKNYLYQCPKCPNIFSDPSNLKRHVQSIHEKQVFRCLHCDFEDTRKKRLEDHLVNAHGDKVAGDEEICLDKGEGAEAIADLTVNEPSLPSFESSEAEPGTVQSEEVFSSPKRSSPNNMQRYSYQCTGCKFRKRRLATVELHVQEAHPDTPGLLVRKIALKCRQIEEPNFSCKICHGISFKKKTLLNQHNLRVHNLQVDTAEFVCPQCGIRCANLPGLKAHQRGHLAKRYLCGSCSKSFLGLNQLKDHVDKGACLLENRQCGVCYKVYSDKVRLELHMRTHTNVKPFPCTICEKSFTQKRSLKEHLLTHDTVRHFECTHCLKKFVQKNHLKYHLASQHKDLVGGELGQRHQCLVCSKVFPFPYQLKKHSMIHGPSSITSAWGLQSRLQCVQCSGWFSSPTLLQLHVQTCGQDKMEQVVRINQDHLVRLRNDNGAQLDEKNMIRLGNSHQLSLDQEQVGDEEQVTDVMWEPQHEVVVESEGGGEPLQLAVEQITGSNQYQLVNDQQITGTNQYQLVSVVNNLDNYTMEAEGDQNQLSMDII